MSPSASKLKKKAKPRFSRSRPETDGSEVSPRAEGGVKQLDPGSQARGSERMQTAFLPFAVSNDRFGQCRQPYRPRSRPIVARE